MGQRLMPDKPGVSYTVSGPQCSALPLTAEQKLAKIEWLANTWFENYDVAGDPRNPSERDVAYDDAAFQILHILGTV
jgi:hypothetical protein